MYILNCLGQKFVLYHVDESIDVIRSTEIETLVDDRFVQTD